MTTPVRTEYVWGIDSTVDDDSTRYRPPHAVRFPVVKTTPKRVYYEYRGNTRFVDRQRLEAEGQVHRLSGGWWEADSTVYLTEPAVYRHTSPAPPSLAELKASYFYPNGVRRMACPSDEDGAPTCMGDTGYCGHSPELDTQVCVNLDTTQEGRP